MSSYSAAVLTDSPFVYYSDAQAAPWVDDIGALDVTITGATANQTGPLAAGDTKAFSFDGTDDKGAVTLDLSDTAVITLEFWLWWDAFANDDNLVLEFGAGSALGGFMIDPNSSDGTFRVRVRDGGGVFHVETISRPSAAVWHHYAIVLDNAAVSGAQVDCVVDGVDVAETLDTDGALTGNFGNWALNLMCRNGDALFGAGDLAHLAVYKSALSLARIQAHFDAADDPDEPPSDPAPALRFVQSGLRLV